jgi:hypothetical protein
MERSWIAAGIFLMFSATGGSAEVPAPSDVIGFAPGTDYKLARYEAIARYFQALDEGSDRVLVETIGESTLGKPLLLALISSPENLARRDRYREISRRLALARDLEENEARALAREGKAVIWIDGGLHATEVAHGQMTPELAHWLATDEGEEARRIRENAIALVMANMNPDGLDIVADWYERNLQTPFETTPPPALYHPYIGHDNNRDWFMFTQSETRAVAWQLYHVWFPQIVYNHHQSGPFPARIWVPPFENPVNPNLDPEVVTSLNFIGEAMKNRFNQEGKPGVVSGVVYDLWWNGSMRGAPDFHNMLGFLSETALYRYATPRCYPPESIPEFFDERAAGIPARTPSTNYTNPWLGGCWHLRDAMDYMLTASRAVLDIGAKLKEDYLFGIYRRGRRQIERGRRAEGGPFAYVVDLGKQHDVGAAVEMLRILRRGGIEIRRDTEGKYVIPPQAFRPFVVDLMEPKSYPDRRQYPGGPPEPPYDTTGYELRLQMGVTVDGVREPFPLPELEVDEIPMPSGGVSGNGDWGFALTPAENRSVTATARLLARGAQVSWASAPFEAEGSKWPAGTLVVRSSPRETLEGVGRELGLTFHALDSAPASPLHLLRLPRIGLYRGFVSNMPEGWTRWLFDQYEIPYQSLGNEEIRSGALDGFDVIVLPSQDRKAILNGHLPGTMPPEFVGGVGLEGAAALERFVRQGGFLVAVDEAVDFAIEELGLPVRNLAAGKRPSEFYIPGSLLRIEIDPNDPLAYGMPSSGVSFFVNSQILEIVPPAAEGGRRADRQADAYVHYAPTDFLASGWAHGAERHLAGKPAAVRVPMGNGQVVLLAFEPAFRAQPHGTFKLLFGPIFASTVGEEIWEEERETPSSAEPRR